MTAAKSDKRRISISVREIPVYNSQARDLVLFKSGEKVAEMLRSGYRSSIVFYMDIG